MTLKIRCPSGHVLAVPEKRAGQRVRCPKCQMMVKIPSKETIERKRREAAEKRARAESQQPVPEASKEPTPPPIQKPPASHDPIAENRPAKKSGKRAKLMALAKTHRPAEQKPVALPTNAEPETSSDSDSHSSFSPPPPPTTPPKRRSRWKTQPATLDTLEEPATLETSLEATGETGATDGVMAGGETKTEKEEAEDTTPTVRGVEYDAGKRWTVYFLGIALAVVALLSMYPPAREVFAHFRAEEGGGIKLWASLALLLGGVQLVYALYLVQLPDWGTTWVVMLLMTFVTTAYATALGVVMTAREGAEILVRLGLENEHRVGSDRLWCLLMFASTCLLTFLLFRVATRWHKAFRTLYVRHYSR